MKILVLQSGGMVGHVVALYLKEHGHEVVGYDENDCDFIDTIVGKLTDITMLSECVSSGRFDAVINCSAIINQDAEKNKEMAVFVNSFLPHYLEKITSETCTVLVHRSTDCIFSGRQGNYQLNDMPDARSFYARSKALGEVVNEKDITIRTSLVGPETDENGNGLFNWFYHQKNEMNGYANAIWTGITTIEFAKEVEFLLKEKAHGLFQLVPDKSIGKYDLLLLFEKHFPSGRIIHRVENERVDKSLVQELNGYRLAIPDYDDMVKEMKDWIVRHSNVYNIIQFREGK